MATADADSGDAVEGRRPSVEKPRALVRDPDSSDAGPARDTKEEPSAFERLPDEIIQQYACTLPPRPPPAPCAARPRDDGDEKEPACVPPL